MATTSTADRYTATLKKDELYSDLFVNLDRHPGKKDLVRAVNEAAVKRSIVNLLLTDNDERLYQPNVGANLKYLLFEPADSQTLSLLRDHIMNCLDKYEPRIRVLDLQLQTSPDEYQINVTLKFALVNTANPVVLNLVLNRVR